MKIINDFQTNEGIEMFVGILIKHKKHRLWIFNKPVHGSYLAFGPDPNNPKKQRWKDLRT